MRGKTLTQIFDAEALGATFLHLAVDVVRGEVTDFTSHWYRARRGEADLVIWTDGEHRIIKHQLCFFGQVVEWTAIHGTRTGFILEEDGTLDGADGDASAATPDFASGAGLSGQQRVLDSADANGETVSEIIRFDPETQPGAVRQAIQMLSRIPDLKDHERSALIFNLRQSPRMHKNARERALRVWAPRVDEIHSNRRPTFWRRLRNWILGG